MIRTVECRENRHESKTATIHGWTRWRYLRALRTQEPRLRIGVGCEELPKHVHHLLDSRLVVGMNAVLHEVASFPDQAVVLSRRGAVGPKIRPPQQQRRLDAAFGRVVVEHRVGALDLLLDQPAHRKGAFIGVWLGIERLGRVAPVGSARQIRDLQVRVARLRDIQDHGKGGLELLSVGRERAPVAVDTRQLA